MNLRDISGGEEEFQVQQAGDGEPAFDTWRSMKRGAHAAFELTDEEKELDTDAGIEGDEDTLDSAAQRLRPVGLEASFHHNPTTSMSAYAMERDMACSPTLLSGSCSESGFFWRCRS